jgi:DtxR family Mn-dependent transcriptional regulator
VPLADVERGAKVLVLRFENEAEDLLHYLMDSGIHPGFKGTIAPSDADEVTIEGKDKSATVTRSVAETVAVRADPSPPQRAALATGQLVFAKERYGR